MKERVLIVGGTSGLGLQLAKLLVKDSLDVHVLSRSEPNKEIVNGSIKYHQADLQHLDATQTDQLVGLMESMNAIAFCQRYRRNGGSNLNKGEDALNEYQVCIQSTALLVEKMLEKINKRSDMQPKQRPKQLLLVGSTYSNYAGFDQDWSYHAVKSALHGLVRYFAVKSNGLYAINMISPPTFIKQGAEEYWQQTEKYRKWKTYPSNGLPTAEDIAVLAKAIMLNSNQFINGQNIVCDGGASCLYLDQQISN